MGMWRNGCNAGRRFLGMIKFYFKDSYMIVKNLI